jgi:hypothetical protein
LPECDSRQAKLATPPGFKFASDRGVVRQRYIPAEFLAVASTLSITLRGGSGLLLCDHDHIVQGGVALPMSIEEPSGLFPKLRSAT